MVIKAILSHFETNIPKYQIVVMKEVSSGDGGSDLPPLLELPILAVVEAAVATVAVASMTSLNIMSSHFLIFSKDGKGLFCPENFFK